MTPLSTIAGSSIHVLPAAKFIVGRVISIANQKGGVGKTTTAVNLGASLAADGRRVLIVDMDPQGNASSGCGVPVQELTSGVYDALMNGQALGEIVRSTEIDSLYVAPSNRDLAGAGLELTELEQPHFRLRDVLKPVKDQYDYLVVDSPPSLDLLTINGLTAADTVLVPVQCEYYAMEGLSKLMDTIEMVKETLNPELRLEGILFTMYDPRNNLSHQVITEVKGFYSEQCFETMIPRNIRLSEAPSHGKPCITYDLASRGSQSYIQLARELEQRSAA